jgi:hypothetical protein
MSVDRRLREGLRAASEAIDVSSHEAYRAVEAAGARRRVRRRASTVAVGLIAAAAIVVTYFIGVPSLRTVKDQTVTPAQPTPAGTYVVDIASSSAAQRTRMTGRWVIVLSTNGSIRLDPPPGFPADLAESATYEATANRFKTNLFVGTSLCETSQPTAPLGIYTWTRSATDLRFTATQETCEARRVLVAGQPWRSSPEPSANFTRR